MKIVIDAGHGGMLDGRYMTDPKIGKLYHFKDWTFYEGVSNRRIARKLEKKLIKRGIEVIRVYHEHYDFPLSQRVRMANLTDADLYLSIHSNAGRGKGFEVFTSEGKTKSDEWADKFIKQLKKDFPEWGMRTDTTDGDEDKEENFFVLKNTKMPAVLLELLFFDEESQAIFLESEIGQNRIVESLNKAI